MLITKEQLAKFSGKYTDDDDIDLSEIYIGSAQQIINQYVGYDIEQEKTIPEIFRLVCLEIASLIQLEENSNLGVNSSSDVGGIGRSFLNIVDYTKYLQRLSSYRRNTGM